MKASKSSSTRRSSRRSKKRSYGVGDIVEIEYGGIFVQGRLLSRNSDENAANPLWRATILQGPNNSNKDKDNNTTTDMELYEASFGEIIGKHVVDDSIDKDSPKTTTRKRKESPVTTTANTDETPILASSKDFNNDVKKLKSTTDSSDSSLAPSSSSNRAKQARASAREERVRRRQAKVEVMEERELATNSNNIGRHHLNMTKKKHPQFHHKHADCITIPMITGTLYLYHGMTRRAEFVRKV